jgi:hypothetical protein
MGAFGGGVISTIQDLVKWEAALNTDKLFKQSSLRQMWTLGISEIPGIVEDYRKAAERAKAAGFDGVELHALMNQDLLGEMPGSVRLRSGEALSTRRSGCPLRSRTSIPNHGA